MGVMNSLVCNEQFHFDKTDILNEFVRSTYEREP